MGWTDTEGNLTKRGAWGVGSTTSAVVMGADLIAGINAGRSNKRISNTMAEISEIQAAALSEKAKQEDLYSNEANALRGWGVARELRALKGAQNVAAAVSGSYGAGDKRLTQDAEYKAYMQQRDMLRALQLESFERNRSARMGIAGLKGRAQQYRIAAKKAVTIGALGGVAKGTNDSMQYLNMINTFWKKGKQ